MRGFNFVPIRSDSMLIFPSGNLPLVEDHKHKTITAVDISKQVD